MYQNLIEKKPERLSKSIMISSDLKLVTEKLIDADASKNKENSKLFLKLLSSVSPIFSFTSQTAYSIRTVMCQSCEKEFQSEEAKAAHQRQRGIELLQD